MKRKNDLSEEIKANENEVVIFHLGKPCVFKIHEYSLEIGEDGLDLDIFTKPNPSCPLGHLGAPELHIESATIKAKNLSELQSEELNVEIGWDTDEVTKEDNIFRIYINQHLALNNNRVKISRRPSNCIEIKWYSDAQDFLDFRNPDCQLEVCCVTEQ